MIAGCMLHGWVVLGRQRLRGPGEVKVISPRTRWNVSLHSVRIAAIIN